MPFIRSLVFKHYTYIVTLGRRKRTLHLYAVIATNLVLPRANAETSHSRAGGPGSS
jgi:hypothetical protein